MMNDSTPALDVLLDPANRTAEPRRDQIGHVRMFGEPGSVDEASRTMRFTCSTGEIDRYSEIVNPRAFAKWLPTFLENPVFMAGHVYIGVDGKPTSIGAWRELRITDAGLEGVAEFMPDDQLAEDYWKRYKAGYQRAVSVGFITHAWEMQERSIDGQRMRVRVFTEAELVEISAVAIPANRQSLVRAASAFRGQGGAAGPDQAAPPTGSQQPIEQLSKLVEPAVERVLQKRLDAGPGGHLCTLVQDVVELVYGRAGQGAHDPYDLPPAERPEPPAASEGDDELKDTLRGLVQPPAAPGD